MAESGVQKVTADVNIGNMIFMPVLEEGVFRFDCSEKDRDAAYPSLSFVDYRVRDTGIAVDKVPDYIPAFECMHGQQTITIKVGRTAFSCKIVPSIYVCFYHDVLF